MMSNDASGGFAALTKEEPKVAPKVVAPKPAAAAPVKNIDSLRDLVVLRVPRHVLAFKEQNEGHESIKKLNALVDTGYEPFGVTAGDSANDFIYFFRK
jgi:hypothetical protein